MHSDLKSMHRNLEKLRNEVCPNAPQSVADILREYEKSEVLKNHGYVNGSNSIRFYDSCEEGSDSVEGRKYGFVVFKSQRLIDHMQTLEKRDFFLDGTFRCVPNSEFKQLITIHYEYKDQVNYLPYIHLSIYNIIYQLPARRQHKVLPHLS